MAAKPFLPQVAKLGAGRVLGGVASLGDFLDRVPPVVLHENQDIVHLKGQARVVLVGVVEITVKVGMQRAGFLDGQL
jgi:hypothetical protein